nr:hypothetical protein [Tanacetum cinerariifolium]
MAYGLNLIQRIADESALAVEIDFTWSFGFGFVEPDRPPIPLSSASVEARISLIMFEFSLCLFADSAMNLNPGPAALYYPPAVLVGMAPLELRIYLKINRALVNSTPQDQMINMPYSINLNMPYSSVEGQYAVLIIQNKPYCLEEQICCLDYRELENTPINDKCSAILLSKVPEKLGDPGKFLIPCVLQDLEVCISLANSRASINLMPLLIYEKLRIGPLKPTQMTRELANRSVTYPIGIAEDVIRKLDIFNFLADFVIVNFKVDLRVPIILGRPFLRTAKALMDLYGEKLTLRIENEELVFRAEKALRYPLKYHHSIYSIDIVDSSSDNDSIQDEPRSGSTTSYSDSLKGSSFPSLTPFETSDSLLEEFADELARIDSFPSRNDDIDFDFESDLRELEFMLNRDPSIDYSSKNNIEMIDYILEEFTNELSLVDSFPLGNDDDLFDFETIMKNG